MASYQYLTLSEPAEFEAEKIKGSRFIAYAFPVENESEIQAHQRAVKDVHPDAGHHCYAWRLGGLEGPFRVSDDGEPSGTGGMPILRQMQGRELADTLVIVVRYFGGTKLGTGGLVRAYGGTAGLLLDSLEFIPVLAKKRVKLRFDYTFSGLVQSLITGHGGEVRASDYGAEVSMEISFLEADAPAFCSEIIERSAGKIEPELVEA